MSQTVEWCGIAASVFTGIALLPQLIKILKQKQAEGISCLMLACLFVGLGLWIFYGIGKNDLIIIISNGFAWLVNAVVIVLTLLFRKQPNSANTTDHSKGAG